MPRNLGTTYQSFHPPSPYNKKKKKGKETLLLFTGITTPNCLLLNQDWQPRHKSREEAKKKKKTNKQKKKKTRGTAPIRTVTRWDLHLLGQSDSEPYESCFF